jgi:hypothetical protein
METSRLPQPALSAPITKALIQDRDYQRKHERSLSASIVHSAVELKEPDLVFSNRAGTATVLLEIWRRQFSAV